MAVTGLAMLAIYSYARNRFSISVIRVRDVSVIDGNFPRSRSWKVGCLGALVN